MSQQNQTPRTIIAGGGTGGHLFPGLALAEELLSRGAEEVRFVGTPRGVEAREVPKAGLPIDFLEVSGIKGGGVSGLLRGLTRLPMAYVEARRLLAIHSPQLVVGVGGYASGPMVLAAQMARIPTAILEQNALPGLTNKLLGRVVDRVFVSFPEAERFFGRDKTRLLGNPIRRSILEKLSAIREENTTKDDETLSILVLGGSLGATALNDLLPDALSRVGRPVRVVHQTGAKGRDVVEQRYQEKGIVAEVREFLDDMPRRYAEADLVICRAGATTLAELGVVGLPSILVPFPHAADNHQEVNAQSLVHAGAAILQRQSETSAEKLGSIVRELGNNPEKRAEMARAALGVGKPHAAKEIAEACIQLVKEKTSQY
jgi:UDP-N-acetylglucosamine--N-acetylmuramyl-(pentapeptide) pyrophosphoryl-undecaprenol N-acetylglucosamine transferase